MGAPRVTPAEIVEMQRLYKELGTYAKVAERVKRSPSTVRKYILMNNVPTPIKIAVQSYL